MQSVIYVPGQRPDTTDYVEQMKYRAENMFRLDGCDKEAASHGTLLGRVLYAIASCGTKVFYQIIGENNTIVKLRRCRGIGHPHRGILANEFTISRQMAVSTLQELDLLNERFGGKTVAFVCHN